VVGHCWPAFLEGRGGRGVAPAFGGFLVIASPAWIASILAFVLAVAVTRMISVGSLAAAAGAFVGYWAFAAVGLIPFHWAALSFLVASTAIIVWRHRPNIDRILRGAEPRVGEAPK
ncbi:MAG: glycerol-3-phosphate acyltransferase, partial [Candidatus Limnocylindria bacterium]